MRRISAFVGALTLALASVAASADIVQIDQSAFQAGAGLITFSEYPQGTVNPTYAPAQYGGGVSSPNVSFGGYFAGQTPGSVTPGACPSGAAVSGCVLGNPGGPLSIDPASPSTFIAGDGSNPTSPVLSGTPQFNGSIAILFSTPQAGVGLDGGYFDSVASTAITAFDANGNVIGQVKNSITGIEFLGLVTSDGSAQISGLLFSLVGDEPAGFAIDNLHFGEQGQVIVPPPVGGAVPEPASLALMGTGMLGLALVGFRKFA
ncbi:MAG TPA: PEP-CTERM sorting domain-containing protein [Edaphobacter sp.]